MRGSLHPRSRDSPPNTNRSRHRWFAGMTQSGTASGHAPLTTNAVRAIVRKRAAAVGVDRASGHSCRVGKRPVPHRARCIQPASLPAQPKRQDWPTWC